MTDRIYGLTAEEVAELSLDDSCVHFLALMYDVNTWSGVIPQTQVLGYLNWAFALGRIQGRVDKQEAVTFIVKEERE